MRDATDHVFSPTVREGDGEDRFKLIGIVDGKLYTAIHAWRGARRAASIGEKEQRR